MFGELKKKMDFLVFEGAPVGLLIGKSQMEKQNGHINLVRQLVDFTTRRQSVRVGLENDRSLRKMYGDELELEDFIMDSKTTSSAEVSKNESKESMAIARTLIWSSESSYNDIIGDVEPIKRKSTRA